MEEVYAEIKKGLRWEYISKLITISSNLLITVLLSRILAPSDYGVMGIVMTVNGIAGVFSSFGFASAIIQSRNLDDDILSSLFNLNIILALIIYLVLFVASPFVAEFYHLENLSVLIRISALGFILSALGIVHSSLLIREMNFKLIARINLKVAVFSGLVGLIFCYMVGIWGLVVQQLVSIVIFNMFYWKSIHWTPKWYFNFSKVRTQLNFGIYMFFSSILDTIFTRIDLLYIGKMFSSTSLGLYSRSTSFDGLIRNLTSTSILSVLFPAFSKNKSNVELVRSLFCEYFILICFIFALISGVFYLCGDNLFVVLFGQNWILSGSYYKIIGIAGFCFPLSSLCIAILESQGKSNLFFYSEVVKKLLIIPFYFLIYGQDISIFLRAMTLYTILTLLITLYTTVRLIEITFLWGLLNIFKYLFMSFCLLFVILKAKMIFDYSNTILNNFLEVVVFIVLYLCFCKFSKSAGLVYAIKLLIRK